MFCAKCGKENPEGTKFCRNCGAAMEQSAPTQQIIVQNTGAATRKGLSVCSLVCGILSMVFCCISCVSIILGILAVIFGVIALATGEDAKAMALCGIVTGIIGSGLIIVMMVGGFGSITELLSNF